MDYNILLSTNLLLYAGENVVMNEKEKTPNFDHVSNRIPKIEVEIKLKWARWERLIHVRAHAFVHRKFFR